MGIDLLGVLVLILLGRSLGILVSRFGFQSIIGEVGGGMVLGALVVLGLIAVDSATMSAFSELGIILVMLLAGIVTDFRAFSQHKKTSIIVGSLGVVVTIGISFLPLVWLNLEWLGMDWDRAVISALFIAVIISNTAIEVTAKIFENRSTSGRLYPILMGASFVDDIAAAFLIGLVSSLARSGGAESGLEIARLSAMVTVFLLASFLVVSRLVEMLFDRFLGGKEKSEKVLLTATILLAFLFAIAARQFGLHEVIGAYMAGLVVGRWGSRFGPLLKRRVAWTKLIKEIDPPLRAIFGPLFFGFIGLTFALIIFQSRPGPLVLPLAALLLGLAVAGKVLGCGLGAKVSGLEKGDALVVGAAMCGRGALELVLIRYGMEIGLINAPGFLALVMMTLATMVVTPVLYTLALRRKKRRAATASSA